MKSYAKNSKVEWKWAGNTITGTIVEIFTESVTKDIKGKKITRHGSPEKPAYLVCSDAGNLALKLATELNPTSNSQKKFNIKLFKNDPR